MKFIYIQNYLKIARERKREFLVLLGSSGDFRVKNQKIVLNDNSLILECDEDSDIQIAYDTIGRFFEKNSDIAVKIVSYIEQSSNEIILTFEDNRQKKVKL